ncbi:MAG: alpha/beta hydrolase [Okeania sp. SIO3B5]|uniref:alpha/beta fold hydrolase n=1 Tax=Okeania sp. SIO3B5 TaxID=2607811 RepID=UPI0013FF1600|nr:alpha/beta hydrolase [Okeania sp. SIO3B5]NEO52109.1 alpha/beta hydrolase [Okeania sp. SIO3B5]
MATIDIQGVPHAYELTNPTKFPHVLIFIHGWLLSRNYWQPLIQRLSPDYQCLSYDLRGFGDSQTHSTQKKLVFNYSPAAYVEDLTILLQKLNISSAWLIGHSLGGTIALLGANRMLDIIKGVVCINSGGGIYIKEEFERFRFAGAQIIKFRPSWLSYLPLTDLMFTRTQVATPISRKWGRQRLTDFVGASYEAALGTLLDSTTESEVHRLPLVVSKLKQPVYFIAGAKDQIMAPKYVKHLASFHWMFQGHGGNVLEIPECGHLAMLEKPNDVAAHIRSLLK